MNSARKMIFFWYRLLECLESILLGMFTKIVFKKPTFLFLPVSHISIHDVVNNLFLILFCNSEVELQIKLRRHHYKECMHLRYPELYHPGINEQVSH